MRVGDPLRIGIARLTVTGVIAQEPDALGEGFSLGPRVIVDLPTLDRTGLVQPGTLYTSRYRLALERGIEIHLPRYQPRSILPLSACLWAGEQGALRPFKHALYEAFFCEGEDIATDREIARAAQRAGQGGVSRDKGKGRENGRNRRWTKHLRNIS